MNYKTYKELNIDKISKRYDSKGFVVVKNFFSSNELGKIDQTLNNIILSISPNIF